jgi:phage terminase small subunit
MSRNRIKNHLDDLGRAPAQPPGFKPGIPDRPDDLLDQEGRQEWDRMIAYLEPLRVLHPVDGSALAIYACTWSDFVRVSREIRAPKWTDEPDALAILAKARRDYLRMARDMGKQFGVKLQLSAAARNAGKRQPEGPDDVEKIRLWTRPPKTQS